MEYTETDIQQILDENDPFNGLSKSELEMMLKILTDRKDKCFRRIQTLSRQWGSKESKKEADDFYVKISGKIRDVETRLGLINKS